MQITTIAIKNKPLQVGSNICRSNSYSASKAKRPRTVKDPCVHLICGDLLGAAASAALLARLFGICDDDLRRLRSRIHKAPSMAPGLLDWLDHVFGWEQDRRAGYAYPLRGPAEAIRDHELTDSLAAVELLAKTFRGEMQITWLLDLVRMILPLDRPMHRQQRPALGTRHMPSTRAPKEPWHAVSVAGGPGACVAATMMDRRRFLRGEAPPLPLRQCSSPWRCQCIYHHFSDRRAARRRAAERGELTEFPRIGVERRIKHGRRAADRVQSGAWIG